MGAGAVIRRCGCRDDDGKLLGTKCPQLRRKGSGSWNPAHGSGWFYRLGVNDPRTGKRRQLSKGPFSTREECQRALDDVRAKYSRGIAVVDRVTVGEWLTEWIEHKRPELKENSWHNYRGQIDRILIPYLGKRKLDELRPAHIRDAFDAYTSRPGAPRTRNSGQTAISRARAVLRSALEDARREGLIETNPATLLRMKGSRSRPVVWTTNRIAAWERDVERLRANGMTARDAWRYAERPSGVLVWTPAIAGQFLDAVHDHRLYALFYVLVTRGLRRGEGCGVQWHDVDWEHGTLTIQRQRVMVKNKITTQTPKTESGIRTISLGTEGVEILKAHRSAQARERLAMGWGHTDWMFTSHTTGDVLDPDKLATEFRRLCFEAHLPPCRLHDLRHLAATLMAASGSDLVTMRDTLGHRDTKMSAAYTSLLPDIAQASADAVASFIPRSVR